MLKSVLKQRVDIQFCILNESSATRNYPETGWTKLAGLVPGSHPLASDRLVNAGAFVGINPTDDE